MSGPEEKPNQRELPVETRSETGEKPEVSNEQRLALEAGEELRNSVKDLKEKRAKLGEKNPGTATEKIDSPAQEAFTNFKTRIENMRTEGNQVVDGTIGKVEALLGKLAQRGKPDGSSLAERIKGIVEEKKGVDVDSIEQMSYEIVVELSASIEPERMQREEGPHVAGEGVRQIQKPLH